MVLAALGAFVGGLVPLLEPMLEVLGRSWDLCWRSWAVLGRSWDLCVRSGAEKCEEHSYLENVLISRAGARSAAWGSVLSCSWGLCCRSWAALGPYVGGLVPLLGPMSAVLGRSWSLCWQSWVALGAYVGDLRPLLGSMLIYVGGPEGPERREAPKVPIALRAPYAFFL